MTGAELRGDRGEARPTLTDALRWIGARVDDIYGSSVGRLEDVWVDPNLGEPRWLLVREGDFGGRHTLIPFEDATPGAGHVWVPYEGDVVRGAPEISPGSPLTQQLEHELRAHFAATHRATAVPSSRQDAGRATDARRAPPSTPTPSAAPDPPPAPAPPPAAPAPRPPPAGDPGVPPEGAEEATVRITLPSPGENRFIELELAGRISFRGEVRHVRSIPRSPDAEDRSLGARDRREG